MVGAIMEEKNVLWLELQSRYAQAARCVGSNEESKSRRVASSSSSSSSGGNSQAATDSEMETWLDDLDKSTLKSSSNPRDLMTFLSLLIQLAPPSSHPTIEQQALVLELTQHSLLFYFKRWLTTFQLQKEVVVLLMTAMASCAITVEVQEHIFDLDILPLVMKVQDVYSNDLKVVEVIWQCLTKIISDCKASQRYLCENVERVDKMTALYLLHSEAMVTSEVRLTFDELFAWLWVTSLVAADEQILIQCGQAGHVSIAMGMLHRHQSLISPATLTSWWLTILLQSCTTNIKIFLHELQASFPSLLVEVISRHKANPSVLRYATKIVHILLTQPISKKGFASKIYNTGMLFLLLEVLHTNRSNPMLVKGLCLTISAWMGSASREPRQAIATFLHKTYSNLIQQLESSHHQNGTVKQDIQSLQSAIKKSNQVDINCVLA